MWNPFDLLQQQDVATTYEQLDITESTDFTVPMLESNNFGSNSAVFQHPDPLSQAHNFEMPKANLHVVNPHFVDGYIRADGTVVEGYYRNGGLVDGSYYRSNPDDILENNLNTKQK